MQRAEDAFNGEIPLEKWQEQVSIGDYVMFCKSKTYSGYIEVLKPHEPIPSSWVYGKIWSSTNQGDLALLHRSFLAYPISREKFLLAKDMYFRTDPAALSVIVGFSIGGSS